MWCGVVWCGVWCGVCAVTTQHVQAVCWQQALRACVCWPSSQDTTGLSASWCSMSVKCLLLVSWLSKHLGNGWRWRSAHVFDLYRKQTGIYKQEAVHERQGLSPCMVPPPQPVECLDSSYCYLAAYYKCMLTFLALCLAISNSTSTHLVWLQR